MKIYSFDFDGILSEPDIFKELFDPIREREREDCIVVTTSREDTAENRQEVSAVVGNCHVNYCGGFIEKLEMLANIAKNPRIDKVIHYDDDPAVNVFLIRFIRQM